MMQQDMEFTGPCALHSFHSRSPLLRLGSSITVRNTLDTVHHLDTFKRTAHFVSLWEAQKFEFQEIHTGHSTLA
jgi:hypothetical protein